MASKRLLAATLALALCTAAPARADDPLGTAGTFRQIGWATCGKPIDQQMQGACDPAPVDVAGLKTAEIVHARIQRAIQLLSFVRMEEARSEAEAALAADPSSIEALTFRGRLALSVMDGQTAELYLNAGLLIAPNDANLLASRAEHLMGIGQLSTALRDVSAALRAQPDNVDALWIRARIFLAAQQLVDAERDLGRALALAPTDRRMRTLRAQVRLRIGQFNASIADINLLLVDRPQDAAALEIRSAAYVALRRTADAIADLTTLLQQPTQIGPGGAAVAQFTRFRVQRAMLLVQLGRNDEAQQDLDALVAEGGKPALLRMQVHLRKSGFPDLALNGERTAAFDSALKNCIVTAACRAGLVPGI